mmetsp:Transcript_49856/g.128283  ORF Transcript_49856/g.128283 Transcript_49856/m.128283 type:complete len:231 (-) Transcript_49856:3165-3857(-)
MLSLRVALSRSGLLASNARPAFASLCTTASADSFPVIDVKTRQRTNNSKNGVKKVRKAGQVPGIVHGGQDRGTLISLDAFSLKTQLRTNPYFFNTVMKLKYEGGDDVLCLPEEIQYHPVSEVPLHINFLKVEDGRDIKVSVPLKFVNEEHSPGLKIGGLLNKVAVKLPCLASSPSIPKFLTVDLTGKALGEAVLTSDLDMPEGLKPAIPGWRPVATIKKTRVTTIALRDA